MTLHCATIGPVHLESWSVRAAQIFCRRALHPPAAKRPTSYVFPDLGIARGALNECERILASAADPASARGAAWNPSWHKN